MARRTELRLDFIAEREETLAKSLAENDRLNLCTIYFELGLLIFGVI
jgi:hypothetical protein